MGTFEFRMPDIGEGIAEAELVEWFVAISDTVEADEPVVEVMTDKASIELPSPVAGEVTWLGGSPGDRIAVGAGLIRFETGDPGTVTPEPDTSIRSPAAPAPASEHPTWSSEAGMTSDEPAVSATASTAPFPRGGRPAASPAVRRRALEAGVDLRLVLGTGPHGRIGHIDLDRFLEGGTSATSTSAVLDTTITDVPVIGLRRAIAERMTLSKARIPHITYVEEVDVTEIESLRRTLNNRPPTELPKLTLLPFLISAMVRAIAEQPELNARFDDDAGVVHQYGGVHVGIATQTPKGLMVPVLRHAEALDVWSCAREIQRLATAAKDAKLTREDLSGSTITITSLGALGGLVTTPVINYPEVAIIGVNKIQIRPKWDGSGFVPRNMMNLSSGFDHRIIDGWNAAVFVQRIRAFLEQPATIFIEAA